MFITIETRELLIPFFHFFRCIKVTTGYGRDQTAVGLIPFTAYEFQVKACTLEHLCVTSPGAYSTTMPAPPKGQHAPQIVGVAATNVSLQWSAPTESNGIINRLELTNISRYLHSTRQFFI